MTSNETKMQSENTLLPWKLDYPEPYELDIVDAKGKHVAKVWLDDAPVHDYNAMQKARAKLIIEAVNTHDALKREVEELRDALEQWWFEASGQFEKKKCGHQFTCVCVSDRVLDILYKGLKS